MEGGANAANALIQRDRDQYAIVQLDPDHPGFRDAAYRARRNAIAQSALDYRSGAALPTIPYTQEEHHVWRTICQHLAPAHARFACRAYLEALQHLALPTDHLPQLHEVSKNLRACSGFHLEPAAGLVDPRVFLCTLGEGIFLATQYIRHASTPLYTPEPDIVHELFGHAVTLANPQLAHINRLLGQAAQRTESNLQLEQLGRIYWFTIEFGVLREEGQIKAYGAGLLSSAGELARIAEIKLKPFDLAAMLQENYDVTTYQPHLYCAESFEQVIQELNDFLPRWPLASA
jgi:phenylalanine-4-hydroxylase